MHIIPKDGGPTAFLAFQVVVQPETTTTTSGDRRGCPLLFREGVQAVVLKACVLAILDIVEAVHNRWDRVCLFAQRSYYWDGLKCYVKKRCEDCVTCKIISAKPKQELLLLKDPPPSIGHTQELVFVKVGKRSPKKFLVLVDVLSEGVSIHSSSDIGYYYPQVDRLRKCLWFQGLHQILDQVAAPVDTSTTAPPLHQQSVVRALGDDHASLYEEGVGQGGHCQETLCPRNMLDYRDKRSWIKRALLADCLLREDPAAVKLAGDKEFEFAGAHRGSATRGVYRIRLGWTEVLLTCL